MYCLRTNLQDWNTQRLWSTYVQLTDLEAVFRSLKNELGLRPIYHWKPQQRVTAMFRRKDGRMLHVRKATQAEPVQQAIYDALGVSATPGGVSKLIVKPGDGCKNSPNVVPDKKFWSINLLITRDLQTGVINLG